jgi:hypothetical protein
MEKKIWLQKILSISRSTKCCSQMLVVAGATVAEINNSSSAILCAKLTNLIFVSIRIDETRKDTKPQESLLLKQGNKIIFNDCTHISEMFNIET